MPRVKRGLGRIVSLLVLAAGAPAGRATAAPETLFETRIAPLLARNCLACHNGSSKLGGLDLSREAKARAGGSRGAGLVPGKPGASWIWKRVAAGEMPPKQPLAAREQRLLKEWIAGGAAWGRDPIDPFRYTSDRRAGYDWWSLQPIARPAPPASKSPSLSPIDAFVRTKLAATGLTPSPPADRRTLIRRLSFDLTGLPPTPEAVDAFLADRRPGAYERLVDGLLASPRYGERWARHWLDVVRFGESQGFERNKLRPSAWKYRDWVVEALNSDLPYDEFVRLQLAGDVLRAHDPLAVIASGFLVAGPYDQTAYTDGSATMRAAAREEELEGLVGTVTQTFLGLTVNCARCHDHKFDPITQNDYYRIAAALAGIYHGEERETGKAIHQGATESRARLLAGGPAHLPAPKEPGVVYRLERGDFRQKREAVTPSGLAALAGLSRDWGLAKDAPEAARRKALAAWITDPKNPLTARVIVNRLWSGHFGAGLVATPNDLGFGGGRPSHPVLLDWLASELIRGGWRLKRIHRLILLSATYRQASRPSATALKTDAENRLLWRQNPRRLEAEALRDAVLAVSGQLDLAIGGPGFRDWTVKSQGNNELYTVFEAVGPEFNRRTLYRMVVRAGTSPFLDVLDCPDPSVSTPRRTATTTPLQALSLLNNPFMERAAAEWAKRLQREAPGDRAAQVGRAYALAFGREAGSSEVRFGEGFAARHGLAQLCLVLLNTNEFAYVD
jgi:hypothetical protein